MPRKAKEEVEKTKDVIASKTKKKTATTVSTTHKKAQSASKKKAPSSKATSSKVKKEKAPTKKATTVAKTTKATAKKASNKKVTTKTTQKKQTTKIKKETATVLEYYDLPYRYNQTVVKILAQTPNTLFIYWDISDKDREKYKKQYGEDFFEKTKPILIIHNETHHYTFEVPINDFANSWYLTVNDTKSMYRIELGRRALSPSEPILSNECLTITTSNQIESPNDHILFEKKQSMLYFKNVKTNQVNKKDTAQLCFIQNMGKIYNLYDLYQKIYQEELEQFDLNNPSSGNPTTTFK